MPVQSGCGGYRPKCVSGGLVVRLPFDPCVELVPVDAGAVSCGDTERLVLALRAPFPCLPVEALESFIGHRVGREPCVGLGMRRVLMAPPADRLQPSDQPQSAVAALTTIDPHIDDYAKHAVDMLIDRIEGYSGPARTYTTDFTLVERASTRLAH